MGTLHPYSIFHLGDAALTIDFGNLISDAINEKVINFFRHLKESNNPHIIDLVPAYSSLTVYYDLISLKKINPGQTAFDTMSDLINAAAIDWTAGALQTPRQVEIPVCYSRKFALDLGAFEEKGISLEELIELHTATVCRVYMLGFLPGFAYMAEVNKRLEQPRKSTPRNSVAAGSVGIAGRQTGIYPMESPGGWQIIGRTPIKLFNKEAVDPVTFGPGDLVKFYSITEDEFAYHQGRHS